MYKYIEPHTEKKKMLNMGVFSQCWILTSDVIFYYFFFTETNTYEPISEIIQLHSRASKYI